MATIHANLLRYDIEITTSYLQQMAATSMEMQTLKLFQLTAQGTHQGRGEWLSDRDFAYMEPLAIAQMNTRCG